MMSVSTISIGASNSMTVGSNPLTPPTAATRVPARIPAAPLTMTSGSIPVASPTVTRVVDFVPAK